MYLMKWAGVSREEKRRRRDASKALTRQRELDNAVDSAASRLGMLHRRGMPTQEASDLWNRASRAADDHHDNNFREIIKAEPRAATRAGGPSSGFRHLSETERRVKAKQRKPTPAEARANSAASQYAEIRDKKERAAHAADMADLNRKHSNPSKSKGWSTKKKLGAGALALAGTAAAAYGAKKLYDHYNKPEQEKRASLMLKQALDMSSIRRGISSGMRSIKAKSVSGTGKTNSGDFLGARKTQKREARQDFKEKAMKHLGTAAKVGAGVAVTGAAAAGANKVYDDHLETQRRGASNKSEARKLLFGERKKR